jgi:hypothetical protein
MLICSIKIKGADIEWAAFLSVAVAFKFITADPYSEYDVYIAGVFVGDSVLVKEQGFDWFLEKSVAAQKEAA